MTEMPDYGPPPPPNRTDPPKPKGTMLHPAMVLAIAAVAGFGYYLEYQKGHDEVLWVSRGTGRLLFVLTVTLLPAWIVNKVSKGNLIAVHVTAGLLLALVAFSQAYAFQHMQSLSVWEDFKQMEAKSEELLQRKLDGENIDEEYQTHLDNLNSKADKISQASSSSYDKGMSALARALIPLNMAKAECKLANRAYKESGMLDYASIRSQQDIRNRIKLLEISLDLSQKRINLFSSLETDIRHELEKERLSKRMTEKIVADWHEDFQPELGKRLFETEHRNGLLQKDALILLHNHYENWGVDHDNNKLVFKEPAVFEQYNRIITELAKQAELYDKQFATIQKKYSQ